MKSPGGSTDFTHRRMASSMVLFRLSDGHSDGHLDGPYTVGIRRRGAETLSPLVTNDPADERLGLQHGARTHEFTAALEILCRASDQAKRVDHPLTKTLRLLGDDHQIALRVMLRGPRAGSR